MQGFSVLDAQTLRLPALPPGPGGCARHSFALKCLVLATSAYSCGASDPCWGGGGGSTLHASVGRILHLWGGVCYKPLHKAPSWDGFMAGSGIGVCVEDTPFSKARCGAVWDPVGRLPLHAGCMFGCFPATGSCFGLSPPAGTLTTSSWTGRVSRG